MSGWVSRVEGKRTQRRMSVEKLLDELGMSRATYYGYKSDPDRHPRNKDVIAAIAQFLGEDPAALSSEMAPASALPPTAFLEAAAARELSAQLYQQHVRAMAHVLGMSVDAPRSSGVDVVVRLLREQLPAPPQPVDAAVVVVPVHRGSGWQLDKAASSPRKDASGPREPYQYQVYILPKEFAALPAAATLPQGEALLRRTQAKVETIMDGAMLPVTREHSTELALPLFRGRADLLLYPGLLDMRPPDTTTPHQLHGADMLVTGVYYAGAPDVAALLARKFGYGFSTFDELGRLQVRAGLRGLPNDRLRYATAGVAHAVLANQSPTAGPMIWATDDPDAILTARAQADLRRFPGGVVVLELSDEVMDYAAYRVGCVDDQCPDENAQKAGRDMLRRQQKQLLRLVTDRNLPKQRTIVRTIPLPLEAARRPDGSYPDAVDAMFDQYEKAFLAVADELSHD